jgi:nucleoside-diphosphate-sugar epimerase
MVLSAKLLRFEPILTSSRVGMMADNWGYTITKANEKLGYEPNFDLKTGINKTAQSYVKLG